MKNKIVRMVKRALVVLGVACTLIFTSAFSADENPADVVEKTVQSLLDEFAEKRSALEGNNRDLYDLVDRLATPLFDFDYISKLVLAKSWKGASEDQRKEFAVEFKKLIIVTYASALFKYTGNESMEFGETKIKEKKGVKFGTVNTEVSINDGAPIPVVYSMLQKPDEDWKVYNLTVGSLNMVLNYRNVIQSSIHSDGLDGVIANIKENNVKNY